MDVVVSPEAEALVRGEGGRLFVWTGPQGCCGGATYLTTSTRPRPGRRFRRVDGPQRFDLFVDLGRRRPEELNLAVRGRRRRRVEAYWNGCVFVT